MKLKKIMESMNDVRDEEVSSPKMTKEQKKKILDMISKYNEYGTALHSEHDLMEIAKTLMEISNGAESFLCNEADHWFDTQTIKRNTASMRKLAEDFSKVAQEGKSYQQRMHAIYEDLGHILNRYFEIKEVADETLPGKPTVWQTTPRIQKESGK